MGGACFAFLLGSDNSHTTPPLKYHLMRKVFCGDGAWLAVPIFSHHDEVTDVGCPLLNRARTKKFPLETALRPLSSLLDSQGGADMVHCLQQVLNVGS